MRILIVDDHPVVRSGLRRMLAALPDAEIGEAATGREALAALRQSSPDLVILDLNLPGGMGGLELIRRMTLAAGQPLAILVLTMNADPLYAARSIEAGARGFVSKNASPAELLDAVARVARGGRYVEQEIAQELAVWSVGGSPASHPLRGLSRRDLEILRLLAEGRSLARIADALGVSYKTVANASSQIKAKLGAAGTADLVRIAIEASRTAAKA